MKIEKLCAITKTIEIITQKIMEIISFEDIGNYNNYGNHEPGNYENYVQFRAEYRKHESLCNSANYEKQGN